MGSNHKNVSISEAAILLGKTERQIRYMIQKQEIEAYKNGGRWTIRLPKQQPEKEDALEAVFESHFLCKALG